MIRIRDRHDAPSIVGLVSGSHFLSHVYLLAYPPIFPLLQAEYSLSTAELGLLVTAIYIPTLVLQIPVGGLVDRVGAKRVLVAGMLLTALGITLSGVASAYWILLGMAFLSGLGQSTYHPADYALLDVVTEGDTEGKAFSLHTFGGFAGFSAAPIAIGGIGALYGWQPALIVVGAVGFVYAGFVHLTMAPVHTLSIERNRERSVAGNSPDGSGIGRSLLDDSLSPLFDRHMVLVFFFYLVSMMAIVGLQSFTVVFAVDSLGLSQPAGNSVLTAFLIAMAVGVIGGGPVADRLPLRVALIGPFVLSAIVVWGTVAAVSSTTVWLVLPLFSLIGVTIGSALPSRDKLANSLVDPGSAGTSFGFYFTGLSLGAVISPSLLGLVIDLHSARAAYLLIGVFLVAAAIIVSVTIHTARPTEPRAPS